jgi:hypothetical protein
MPSYRKLRVGDRIRLVAVPSNDVLQTERELARGLEDAGWTADTLELIIKRRRILTISSIDEYGYPWFECRLRRPDGALEHHSMAIMDDHSWKLHENISSNRHRYDSNL